MHLLRLEDGDNVSLVKREGSDIPKYAILSHTWLSDDEEVSFQDLKGTANALDADGFQERRKTVRDKPGYRKVLFCGKQAARDGLQYFWVDTCCIDKESSAELPEALNSMFRWYQQATKCYVYMADVLDSREFNGSKWFTRGW
jgi:hypothetical protein